MVEAVPTAAPFALTEALLVRLAAAKGADVLWWADLVDAVGPAVLPFVVRPSAADRIPWRQLGVRPVEMGRLTPQPGEAWVLMRFDDRFRQLAAADCALRTDGFALVLEWREGQPDSPLLSTAFHCLAALVRDQHGVSGWGLWPAFGRYGDKVAFTDPALFADSSRVLAVASAYGALAAGLRNAVTRRHPPYWSFPTLQWDESRGRIAAVAGLGEKLAVAADAGASVVSVAAEQLREARGLLARFRAEAGGERFRTLRVRAVGNHRNPLRLADDIAWGDYRHRRLLRRIAAAVALPLALVAIFGTWRYWDEHRTVSKYYAAITNHYGLPVGVHEVSPDAVGRRMQTFRFDFVGVHSPGCVRHPWQVTTTLGVPRRLERVVNVNARNVPCRPMNDGFGQVPMIQQFRYREDGTVQEMWSRARGGDDFVSGPILRKYHYDLYGDIVNGRVTLRNGDGTGNSFTEITLSQVDSLLPQEDVSRICEYVLDRDAEGRMTRKVFYNGVSTEYDGDGVGGVAYEYNYDGLVTRLVNLAAAESDTIGSPEAVTNRVANRFGVVTTEFAWEGPLLRETSTRDLAGRYAANRFGVKRCRYEYDADGNVVVMDHLDEHGQLAANEESAELPMRLARTRLTWIDGMRRLMAREDEHGGTENLLLYDGPSPFVREEYDERGDLVLQVFVDARGNPVTNELGVSHIRCEYDWRTGNERSYRTYGPDGVTPVCHDGQIWSVESDYDDEGHEVESRNLGTDGRLVTNCLGTARMVSHYEHGRLVLEEYYDETNRLCTNDYAVIGVTYDRLGRQSEIRFYAGDAARTPVTSKTLGFARMRNEYDERGRTREKWFFAAEGTDDLIIPTNGNDLMPPCRKYVILYDEHGNMACAKHYDAQGRLLMLKGRPYAYSLHRYDCRGREVSVERYDAEERLVTVPTEGVISSGDIQ